MEWQQVSAVATTLTDEQQRPVIIRHDEAVAATEPRGCAHDHRHTPTRRTERAAVVNGVIG
jgi:hypothetical protein